MCIISLPVAASNSTGMNPCGGGDAGAVDGAGGFSNGGGPSRLVPVVEHPAAIRSSSANRFMSVFLSPREKAHQEAEVAPIARGVRESVVRCDFESVLPRSRLHFVLANEVRFRRLETIDERGMQE